MNQQERAEMQTMLAALWDDESLTNAEIARRVGVNEHSLVRVARNAGLPQRTCSPYWKRANTGRPTEDPTPEQIAEMTLAMRREWPQERVQARDEVHAVYSY
jgi:hypothetical protein